MRRLLIAMAALTVLSAVPAAALPVPTTASDWGCAGIALVGGLCVNDPFTLLGV